jgi:hypothetical protein
MLPLLGMLGLSKGIFEPSDRRANTGGG